MSEVGSVGVCACVYMTLCKCLRRERWLRVCVWMYV